MNIRFEEKDLDKLYMDLHYVIRQSCPSDEGLKMIRTCDQYCGKCWLRALEHKMEEPSATFDKKEGYIEEI